LTLAEAEDSLRFVTVGARPGPFRKKPSTLTRRSIPLGLAACMVVLTASVAAAGPGDVDTTFANGGMKLIDFGGQDGAADIARTPGGKLVLVGSTSDTGVPADFALARVKPGGGLDQTFSGDGKKTTDFFGGADTGFTVEVLQNGKIVAAGWAEEAPGQDRHMAVARYRENGSLDPNFSSDGRAIVEMPYNSFVYDLVVLGDGSIILLGELWDSADNEPDDAALARLRPNGTLDVDFGDNGTMIDFIEHEYALFEAGALTNNRILAVGLAGSSLTGDDVALARYRLNGSPDPDFGGGDGKKTFSMVDEGSWAEDIVVLPDDRFVVTGRAQPDDCALAKFKTAGVIDGTFGGGDGVAVTNVAGDPCLGATILRQGEKLVVAAAVGGDFGVFRYGPLGGLHADFGMNGIGRFDGGTDIPNGMVFMDDRIFVSGRSDDDFALVAFQKT
jgi:uncharacterized delta-60 repeat protein